LSSIRTLAGRSTSPSAPRLTLKPRDYPVFEVYFRNAGGGGDAEHGEKERSVTLS